MRLSGETVEIVGEFKASGNEAGASGDEATSQVWSKWIGSLGRFAAGKSCALRAGNN